MGKEWHLGGRSSRRAPAATAPEYRRNRPSLPGCMSTLFHFFDFHSYHITTRFVFNKHHQHSSSKPSPHGVEAPRNNLELDEASISCLRNKEENLNIQVGGGLQIKTSRNGSKKYSKASEQQLPNIDHIASESPRTPNLLARLMGLDILPQTSSRRGPNLGARHNVSGTRSLPESPRVSLARLSDVDRHHRRLSLQISFDKENIKIGEGIEHGEERVRRKDIALIDITNSNRKLQYGEQKARFSRSKAKKSSKKLKKMVANESSSKFRNVEPSSMPMPKPKAKAKLREEEAFGYNLHNNLNSPTIFSVKKDPSPPVAKIPHEQPRRYYRKGKNKQAGGDSSDGGAAELEYTAGAVPVKEPRRERCKGRLPSDVVRERAEGFPRARRQVVKEDLGKWSMDKVGEAEGIVKVVELHILDSLLRETTAAIIASLPFHRSLCKTVSFSPDGYYLT